MSCIAVLCAGLLAAQVAAGHTDKELPLRVVGAFDDFRETGQHVYGYRLELWRRADGTLTGVLAEAAGQPADFPLTRLDRVELDDTSGRLRFTARWCDQQLIFDGRIDGDHLRGTLEHTNGERPARVETIELHRGRSDRTPVSESDWERSMSGVLRRLEPRC